MIRVFGHYISKKALLFVALDVLFLLLMAHVGISIHYAAIHGNAPGFSSVFAIFFAFCLILVMAGMGLYQMEALDHGRSVYTRLVVASIFVVGVIGLLWCLVPSLEVGPTTMAVTAAGGLTLAGLLRFAFYKWSGLITRKRRILVLGTGSRVVRCLDYTNKKRNFDIVGFVPFSESQHYVPSFKLLRMAPGETLLSLVKEHQINEIVLAIRQRRGGQVPVQELLECRFRGVAVTELPTFFEREDRRVMLESLNPSWMLLADGFHHGFWRILVKRSFDLFASACLLIITLPIMLLTAICIAMESGFPIVYRQERVGQDGRLFTIYKFRSMRNDAERDGTPRWAADNDNRITVVGRIIRKLRIDELPQILNIFNGDMSFVGPRPERPFFVDQLVKQIPYFSLRHSVKPGITGWAQINYSYGASLDDTVEKLQYDLYYLKNQTLFLDLMIIIATVEVVLWGKGAR